MRASLSLVAAFQTAFCWVGAAAVPRFADAAPIHCVISNPLSCPNTNYLSWSPGFEAALTNFLGTNRVDYFRHDRGLSWQAQYGLGGPPDSRKSLPGGLFLFAACPAHDCGGQAAAIVLNDRGTIQGIGFSSYHCGPQCDFDHRYLDFYVRRGPTADTVVSVLTGWGQGSSFDAMTYNPKANDGLAERTAIVLLH